MNLLEMYKKLTQDEKEELINLIIKEIEKKEKEAGKLLIQI